MDIIVQCPHCQLEMLILSTEINCGIFRHGVYKHNFTQINPHMPKDECDRLFGNNMIYGCGKPFRILHNNSSFTTEICEYI